MRLSALRLPSSFGERRFLAVVLQSSGAIAPRGRCRLLVIASNAKQSSGRR
jgi:hypothetical protein